MSGYTNNGISGLGSNPPGGDPLASEKTLFCGTTLVYRGIEFVNCTLRNFEQSVVMDESNTDLLLHRFKISITGWITWEALRGIGVHLPDGTVQRKPKDTMILLKQYLMHPRYRLSLFIENDVMLDVRGQFDLGFRQGEGQDTFLRNVMPTGKKKNGKVTQTPNYDVLAQYDVENGPVPESCRVTYVAGANAFYVEFDVRASVVGCDPDSIYRNPKAGESIHRRHDVPDGAGYDHKVLNNRWSIEETRDADFMITRTCTGKLVIRSYTDGINGSENLRYLVIPRLLRGFKREKMTFVQSPSGLEMMYTIVDVQRYAAPPLPAIDWRATHSESIDALTGATGQSTVSVWLKGAPNVKKKQLFLAALRVIEHRLGKLKVNGVNQSVMIPQRFNVIDPMHLPELTLEVTVRRVFESSNQGPSTTYSLLLYGALGTLPAVNSIVPAEPNLPNGKAEPNNFDRDETTINQWCRDKWPVPIPWNGSAPVGHFITYLQNPCFGYHGIPNESDLTKEDGDKPKKLGSNDYNDPEELDILIYEADQDQMAYIEAEVFPKLGPDENPYSPGHLQALYSHYEIESKYVTSQGLSAAPLATPAGTSENQLATIRVSHPVTYRDVWIRGRRLGALPETPYAPEIMSDQNGITERLVHSEIVPVAPQLTVNRDNLEYEIEAYYRYALLRTPTNNEKLRVGSLPWDLTNPEGNSFSIGSTQNENII